MIGELNKGTKVALLIAGRLLALLALLVVLGGSPRLRGWTSWVLAWVGGRFHALGSWVDHHRGPAPRIRLHPTGDAWITADHGGRILVGICVAYVLVAGVMYVQRKRKADGSTAGRTALFAALIICGLAVILSAVAVKAPAGVQHPFGVALRGVGSGFGHVAGWLSGKSMDAA